MTARTLLAAVALLMLAPASAAAQDRPLLEPFRIGYARNEAIAERLRATTSLERALRRKGFLVTWQAFDKGLDAARALHAEEIDLALDVSLPDVISAKREHLKMVFIAELRSIVPSCCELEQLFADHMFKRYTLSSEYLADRREDVLLIVHEEMTKALQQPAQLTTRQENPGPVPGDMIVASVTRNAMQAVQHAARALSEETPAPPVDLADVNYWLPQQGSPEALGR